MNLVDAYVTKVIGKRKFCTSDWGEEGMIYDVFTVEYHDMGGTGTTELWFPELLDMKIEVGHKFQH